MKLSEVKANMGKIVYFSFCGNIHECILSGCIFRMDKSGKPYYQAELTDKKPGHSVMIVNLENVFCRKIQNQNADKI